MELNVSIKGDLSIEEVALLKNFIENQNLEGIEQLVMERATHHAGEQGLGKFLGSLMVTLTENLNVVKEFFTQVNIFAAKYDRRIQIGDIVIPTNKLTGEQIERIALKALGKN
ncbi:MAG: hypothetical protein INR73_15280 [Williamsia sp.]|nr:hypothetical protein [Williamsia sp.]